MQYADDLLQNCILRIEDRFCGFIMVAGKHHLSI
jgi:hypothetical protein